MELSYTKVREMVQGAGKGDKIRNFVLDLLIIFHHGHGQQCGDWGSRGIKRLNGNGKNIIKKLTK